MTSFLDASLAVATAEDDSATGMTSQCFASYCGRAPALLVGQE
jgi:hypothetical protein